MTTLPCCIFPRIRVFYTILWDYLSEKLDFRPNNEYIIKTIGNVATALPQPKQEFIFVIAGDRACSKRTRHIFGRRRSALTPKLFALRLRSLFLKLNLSSTSTITAPTWVSPYPRRLFLRLGNAARSFISAQTECGRRSCFPLNCR